MCIYFGNGLLGDMMINGYYFIMSIYGWYHWTRKKGNVVEFPIARISKHEKKNGGRYIYINICIRGFDISFF